MIILQKKFINILELNKNENLNCISRIPWTCSFLRPSTFRAFIHNGWYRTTIRGHRRRRFGCRRLSSSTRIGCWIKHCSSWGCWLVWGWVPKVYAGYGWFQRECFWFRQIQLLWVVITQMHHLCSYLRLLHRSCRCSNFLTKLKTLG